MLLTQTYHRIEQTSSRDRFVAADFYFDKKKLRHSGLFGVFSEIRKYF